jgi:hypothetical protein
MLRKLRTFYGHFAAAYGTCFAVTLLLAPVLPLAGPGLAPVVGWVILYGFPIVAVGYATFRAASAREPTIEELYHEIARREPGAMEVRG